MAVTEAASVPRRDRLRAATLTEIRQVGRRLLVEGGVEAVTLRAIARGMGMTAPALYRYYDSREDVVEAVAVDCYDEVIAQMEAGRDAQPEADIPARLLAATRAFRTWALEHRPEFGLVFANPVPGLIEPCEGALEQAGQRFGLVFARLFADLLATPPGVPLPAADEIDPAFVEQLSRLDAEIAGMLPLEAQYLFVKAWTRLYGCVCLEIFGHLGWAMDDAEPVFEDTLRDLAALLGMADAYRPPQSSARDSEP